MAEDERNRATAMFTAVERLQLMLEAAACGGEKPDEEYRALRKEVMDYPGLRAQLPPFLASCRNIGMFWPYIQAKGGYKERRAFLREAFEPALGALERSHGVPVDLRESLRASGVAWLPVEEHWQRILDRVDTDPEAAITSARALMESVCKCILDEAREPYDEHLDLPKLYSKTAKLLKLAPDDHSEEIFKQILGGCHSTVQGMAGLRNRYSDAHGKGVAPVKVPKTSKPSKRHADLAVSMGSAMCRFLIETWMFRQSQNASKAA